METIKLITYGLGNTLDVGRIKPIVNRDSKPVAGLWASPTKSNYGWREFCLREDYGDLSTSFVFSVTGNILKIDSKDDLEKIEWYCKWGYYFPDFELMQNEVDAIWLTITGLFETKNLLNKYVLYGWDCESVLIMNKNVINNGEGCGLI